MMFFLLKLFMTVRLSLIIENKSINMSELISCTIYDDAANRGRIPSHYIKMCHVMLTQVMSTKNKQRVNRRKTTGGRKQRHAKGIL